MNKKAVLLSVQPKWCALIANGKKTVEVRKTRPKIETPFKCYIYQIKSKDKLLDVMKDGDDNYGTIYHGKPVFIKTLSPYSNGNEQKVIGEFICDSISEYEAEFAKLMTFTRTSEKYFAMPISPMTTTAEISKCLPQTKQTIPMIVISAVRAA